jgi:hypothetical protein
MIKRGNWTMGARRAGLALGLVAVGLVPLARGAAAAELPGKLKKQIEVMDKILDEVLVDSQNLLVSGQHVTNGVYLSEFGVVFTFEASLLTHGGIRGFNWDSKNFDMHKENGKWVINFGGDDEDSTKDDVDKEKPKTEAQLYEGGKNEIIGALLDYGDTMTGLQDTQWVAVAAFMDGNDYFQDKSRTLVVKAKMADLRAYGADKLSKSQMTSRIVIEEY